MRYFVLDNDHTMVEVHESNLEVWQLWMKRNIPERFVGRMEIWEDYLVSTVFMGNTEHDFDPDPFLTAVFAQGKKEPVYTCRWPSWEAATLGHREIVVRTFTRWVIEREHGGYPLSEK